MPRFSREAQVGLGNRIGFLRLAIVADHSAVSRRIVKIGNTDIFDELKYPAVHERNRSLAARPGPLGHPRRNAGFSSLKIAY
jgi:hypothetical protein